MSPLRTFSQFFKRERPYILMTLFIALFFYLVAAKAGFQDPEEAAANQEIKQIDQLMEENLNNPEFLTEQFQKNPVLSHVTEGFILFAMAMLGVGIFANVRMVRQARAKQPWLVAGHGVIHGDWGIDSVIRTIILFLFASICSNMVLFWVKRFLPEPLHSNFLLLLHTVVTDTLVLVFVFHFVNKFVGSPLKSIGIKPISEWRSEIGAAMQAYVATLPSFMVLMAILIGISAVFAFEPPPHPLIYIFLEEGARAPWLIYLSLAVACILSPIVEEIFFRGFVYGAIRKKWGMGWATVITSAFFAYVHDSWFAFAPIFFLSCVLCYLYEKRKNLIPSIALHMVHNGAFIFYFFLLKRLLIPEN